MSATTKINWTDATWNPVSGCTPAGVGCAHCYAARVAERFPAVHGVEYSSPSLTSTGTQSVPFSRVICHPERLGIPERWKKPRAIMCPSMGDLFHIGVSSDFRWEVFKVMERCPQHTFIVLTKRPEQMREYMQRMALALRNVVLGVSCSTQAEADHAIPILLDTLANRRIVSLEPLVGPVDASCFVGGTAYKCECGWHRTERDLLLSGGTQERRKARCMSCGKLAEMYKPLDGVIVGGESGPGARPMHPAWVRSLRDQCAAAGVPFFFKQWGEWVAGCQTDSSNLPSNSVLMSAIGDTGRSAVSFSGDGDDCVRLFRVGRSRAGRLLDGRTHDALCWDVRGKGDA